jgi:hypothetical protein
VVGFAVSWTGGAVLEGLSDWQGEVEHRSMAGLAGHADLAAVGLDDCFGNCQAHPGALDLQALIATAIKLLEYQGLLEIVDPWSPVGDAGHYHPVADFSGDVNRRFR